MMKICVLTGGSSAERDVAFASAAQVVAALRRRGHEVTVADSTTGILDSAGESRLLVPLVRIAPPDVQELAALAAAERRILFGGLLGEPALRDADVIFLGLHGGRGEDGTVQALLETAGIRYTGAGPLGSGVAMDKDLTKRLFLQAEVLTAAWLMAPVTAAEVDRELDWPVVVKPGSQGSTVGLTVVRDPAGLAAAIAEAGRHDDEVMVEAFVPGRELTVGILGDDALAVGEIIPRHELFDYECKYTPGMSQEIFPAEIPDALAEEVREIALRAHDALKLEGYSRVDFRLTDDHQLFCLEVNTLPGMTATSLMPQSAAAVGIDFATLCERICELAVEG
ncbi:MAG TPA: D-alanine--D-alanine ligase [Gemmatimonadales bacterium]|jgi:D-alanine-D-alanine ligase